MPIVAEDEFNPKKIYDDLIKRAKEAKEWFIYCYVSEEWYPKEPLPFDIQINDGLFTCRVVCATYKQAQIIVSDRLPVIRFIEDPEE